MLNCCKPGKIKKLNGNVHIFKKQQQMKNTPLRHSEIKLDSTCCILPQIAQITQKKICENLRNLRLKEHMQVIGECHYNQQ